MLERAGPYDLSWPTSVFVGSFGAMYPVFVRGCAYLAHDDGAAAAIEFQKILAHSGIIYNDPVGAVAQLYLGRAYVLTGQGEKAKAAYLAFLTAWKGADPGTPLLKKAIAEFEQIG